MKYIYVLALALACFYTNASKLHSKFSNIYELSKNIIDTRHHILTKRSKLSIDSNVDDIKESTSFAGRDKKWKQIMEGEMFPEHHMTSHPTSSKKAEIPHIERIHIPEPEMMMGIEKKTKIEIPNEHEAEGNAEVVKSDDFDGSPAISDEETEGKMESASGSGSNLDAVAEEESDVVKSDEGFEPEKENTKVGKRRGSMKCERKCAVPLDYHECAHPRCDLKIGTIKDLCFYLCKHQKERCEDVCV